MKLFNVRTTEAPDKNGKAKIKWFKAGIFKIEKGGKTFLRLFCSHVPEQDPNLPVIDLED